MVELWNDALEEQASQRTTDPRRQYYIFCDESGVHGSKYYSYGTFWLPYQRRGDLQKVVKGLREKFGYRDEIKWNSVNRYGLNFYLSLVDEFFKRRWMMFHGIVVRRSYVDRQRHKGSWDLARRKHFTLLLRTKLVRFAGPEKGYRIRVDPLPSRYVKADEVMEKVTRNVLRRDLGLDPIVSLISCDSKNTLGIQIADLLTGAVTDAWEQRASAQPKVAVKQSIAERLGWPDLRSDTKPHEWKFNIWYLSAADGADRESPTRPVRLLYPMPRYGRRRSPVARKTQKR